MSARTDMITTSSNSVSNRYYGVDALNQRASNTPLRKTPSIPSSISISKNNSFLTQNNSNPDSNIPSSNYTNSGQHTTTSSISNKNVPKGLTIETAEDGATYSVINNSQINSYSATNNSANYYAFTRNTLMSSLNGNLTTKYSKAQEPIKSNGFISPSSKTLMSTKTLSSPTNNSYVNPSQSTTLSSGTSNPLLSTLSPTSYHFKNFSTKSFAFDSKPQTPSTSASVQLQSTSSQHIKSNTIQNNAPSPSVTNSHTSKPTSKPTPTIDTSMSNVSLNNLTSATPTSNSQATPTSSQGNLKKNQTPLPNHEPTKCSVKRNGIVKAYAANTNQGIVRNYNEDRVSIILNIMKPASRVNEEWPKCSFFGVYDGHGGVTCADFLRDNLHQYVIKEPAFPWNPKEAMVKGFEAAEKAFLELAQSQPSGEIDRSGSCAIVVLIVGDMCYVANVGDSRAVMSGEGGQRIFPLSRDHKPMDELEQKRIIEGGGKIYQTQAPALRQVSDGNTTKPQMQLLLGPHRVFPGRLSVSRTFGDIEAKLTKLGGNPNVVVATPEIKAFRITNDHDFIILASDGIYDKLSSREVVKTVWDSTEEKAQNVHHQCGLAVEGILREAINKRTLDNITVVMIGFKNFKQKLFPRDKSSKKANDENLQKEEEITSIRSPSSKNLSQTSFNFKPTYKKEQENSVDLTPTNSSSTLKKENLLTDPGDSRKSYEKNSTPLTDLNANKKIPSSKRGNSNIGISESQKFDTLKNYSNTSGTFKSTDYRNGELVAKLNAFHDK